MSGTAEVHQSTLTPTKLELLAAWLPTQPWFDGDAADLASVGTFRFVDPDGDVGVETHLVSAGGKVYHVPVTYRGEELKDGVLVGEMDHSLLGKRYVYDATSDPVYVAELTRVIREGDTEADVVREGELLPKTIRAEGSGIDSVTDQSGLVRIVREIGDPHFSTERARGLLVITYGDDGDKHEEVVAVMR
ncbi:CG0192-related protein [Aestuariimicrobium ganziense]|uniref:CG0192-related protein n=1 Tax=Aestuariimicrobium ganziense TaxID=2773677 RepID=UPI001944E1BD|nr:hypothetical protein [Aestuariimicrobium ganziense]